MTVDTCKERYAEDIEIGDELDLDGDEYGDNDLAVFTYALVDDRSDIYKNKEPWVTLYTSQGIYCMPAGHLVKVRVKD